MDQAKSIIPHRYRYNYKCIFILRDISIDIIFQNPKIMSNNFASRMFQNLKIASAVGMEKTIAVKQTK